jgi:hypothetical protein
MLDAEDSDRDIILAWFLGFQEEGDEELARYILHCGIDIDAAPEIDDAIALHYQLPDGTYDIDRAANDLATWPPVAARIAELQAERAATNTDSIASRARGQPDGEG